MNKGELLRYITDAASRYRKKWREQLVTDDHMHDLGTLAGFKDGDTCYKNKKNQKKLLKWINENIPQEVFDALMTNFINHIGLEQWVDYAIYARDLKTHTPKEEKPIK